MAQYMVPVSIVLLVHFEFFFKTTSEALMYLYILRLYVCDSLMMVWT